MASYFNLRASQLKIDRLWVCQDDDLVQVDKQSPYRLRRAVLTIAQYFRREFDYDFVQFGLDDDDNYKAFLFLHYSGCDAGCLAVVGACCFRWRNWRDAEPGWALQWVWLHPYCRRRGRLTLAWPQFKNEFGNFHVESPISTAMAAFLSKNEPL